MMLEEIYYTNPMVNLELAKYGFNFELLKKHQPKYLSTYFAEGVKFIEPQEPADFKREILNVYPEGYATGVKRIIKLFENINRRISDETQDNSKSICHLIIANAVLVDETA